MQNKVPAFLSEADRSVSENNTPSPTTQAMELLDEKLSKCSFTPVQLDPRPNAQNPEVHFGVEITIPGYENITNLDHHRPGDTNETPSSAEQALNCELPSA